MAKVGERNPDVVANYFGEDDSVSLILIDKHLMISLDDLGGEELMKVIKCLKKPNAEFIDFIGAPVKVHLSKEMKKKLISHLEDLKEERKL